MTDNAIEKLIEAVGNLLDNWLGNDDRYFKTTADNADALRAALPAAEEASANMEPVPCRKCKTFPTFRRAPGGYWPSCHVCDPDAGNSYHTLAAAIAAWNKAQEER